MKFLFSVLFALTQFAISCHTAVFPWNDIAGMLLTFGRPILGAPPQDLEPIAYMLSDQIVFSNGYPVENHLVETADGYVLTVNRVPYGRNSNNQSSIASVIIITGILTDGSSFLMNTEENNAVFLLADAGYDVWLMNYRGSHYSREHRFLNPDKDKKYWDFSFHDIGMFDMPATVDYVTGVTGRKQVYVVGYSMGAAATTVMLSEMPIYQTKVRAALFLAPAIRFKNPKFRVLYSIWSPLLDVIGTLLDEMEVLSKTPNMIALYQTFCGGFGRPICLGVIDAVFGEDLHEFNRTRIEVFMSHILSGTSVKVLRHYLQMYKGFFRKYDYGTAKNFKLYGHHTPPDYDIKSIGTPIVVMYGPGDTFVMAEDIVALSQKFRNLVGLVAISHPSFNHLDFMCAKQQRNLFAEVLIRELGKLQKSVTDTFMETVTYRR